MEPFAVSAPGKVIIFGEHLAVYYKPAIAAALDVRCYLLATPSPDPGVVRLEFSDINLVHQWRQSELPWEAVAEHVVRDADGRPSPTAVLDPAIQAAIRPSIATEENIHFIACQCFLYMYLQLCSPELPGVTIQIRLTLPIGAGLGLSALTAVCLALALATMGGHVAPATAGADETAAQASRDAEYINDWSFVGEMCFHGNPSGIDNAVATFGGAVMFQRQREGPSTRTNIRSFPPLLLLLTNTRVPRLTAELVAGVGDRHQQFPKLAAAVLDAMGHVAEDAYHLMTQPTLLAADRLKLRQLVDINHGLLVALGVSHPALETVKSIGDVHAIGLTKLTGAGGGGCAITLITDDADAAAVAAARERFAAEGYESFETKLGGRGVGYLAATPEAVAGGAVFTADAFTGLATREDIQQRLGNSPHWKYW